MGVMAFVGGWGCGWGGDVGGMESCGCGWASIVGMWAGLGHVAEITVSFIDVMKVVWLRKCYAVNHDKTWTKNILEIVKPTYISSYNAPRNVKLWEEFWQFEMCEG